MERSRSFLLQKCQPPHLNMCVSVSVLGAIIVAFLFAYAAFGEDSDSSTLALVSIIFRHGDKNPTESYVNDPYKEAILWPEGWGQLTKRGKTQMYELGKTLQKHYGKFVGPHSLQKVRVDSSDHDRCHQSAGAMLAGLFPPEGYQIWNSQLLWLPIPIHATPRSMDKLIVVKAPCPLYDEEKNRTDADLASQYDAEFSDLYKYLTKHSGQLVNSIQTVESLYNILEIEAYHGKTLPEWTHTVFPSKMQDIAALCLASFTYTPALKRLWGGPLVGQITHNMEAKANGKLPESKLFLYSAHDLTIVNVWRALGFSELLKPELGAALIVELHGVAGDHHVELLYLNSSAAITPTKLDIPGCSSLCRLQDFVKAVEAVIPLDWDKECQIQSGK